jgi:hypothetical protein
LDRSKAQLALNQTREKIEQLMRRPPAATSADSQVVDAALVELPANAPAVALMPWLDRRLQVACLEAASTARAAAALHATADSPT